MAEYPSVDCLFFIASEPECAIPLLRLVKCLQQGQRLDAPIDAWFFARHQRGLGADLTGLVHALAQSDHRLSVRNIDLHEECSDLEFILREPPSDRGELVRLDSGRRYRQAFVPLDQSDLGEASALRRGGVYLIFGGSGSVGRVLTRHLTEEYKAHVVWIGSKPNVKTPSALYVQADVTDLDSLRIAIKSVKKTWPVINGAIFAAVRGSLDKSIDQISESEFRDVLEVKSRGSVNVFTALQHEPLDFLCYFSSAQSFSFSGARNSPAYAAGVTAADNFVRTIQQTAPFPVGTINWGLWKSSRADRVLAGRQIGPLEDHEGIRGFERFTRLLIERGCSQLLCFRAAESVKALMNRTTDERFRMAHMSDVSVASLSVDPRHIAELNEGSDREPFHRQIAAQLFARLRTMGAFLERGEFQEREAVRKEIGVIDSYARWWDESLSLLESRHYLEQEGSRVRVSPELEPIADDQVRAAWEDLKRAYRQDRELKTPMDLADACLQVLPQILRGTIKVTDVLFPDASMELMEGLYKNNAQTDFFNHFVAELVKAAVARSAAADPKKKVRIIEVGAGTGGTSAFIFDALAPYAAHVEYTYTDISKAFLHYADKHFGPACPYLKYAIWNADEPPAVQGIDTGAFDIVVLTNALHATRDVRRTIRNVKAALKREGTLILTELSEKSPFISTILGLLDGWWLFEDDHLRIPGSPLLSPERWGSILTEAGYRNLEYPVASARRWECRSSWPGAMV